MDENMKIPLFHADSSVQEEGIEKEEDIDIDESIEKVMESSSAKVAEIATSNITSSISTLKSKTRKRYVPATQTELCSCRGMSLQHYRVNNTIC